MHGKKQQKKPGDAGLLPGNNNLASQWYMSCPDRNT
jgi:hypothetical protein